MIRIILAAGTLLLLSACGARQCVLEGDYLQARQTPPLVNPDGGLPAPDPSYQIPPAPGGEAKAARSYQTAEGEEITDCIDRPPRLTVQSEPS